MMNRNYFLAKKFFTINDKRCDTCSPLVSAASLYDLYAAGENLTRQRVCFAH